MDDELQLPSVEHGQIQYGEVKEHEPAAINEKDLEVLHPITSEAVDRAGDIVRAGGMRSENFMKNPVVLRNHSYKIEDIIGRSESLVVEKDRVLSRTRFAPTDSGREAFELVKGKFLRAWSIGFQPTKHELRKDDKERVVGFEFKEWDLLEYSLIAIPCNPEIVIECVKSGMVSRESIPAFFRPPRSLDYDAFSRLAPDATQAPEAQADGNPNNDPNPNPDSETDDTRAEQAEEATAIIQRATAWWDQLDDALNLRDLRRS